MKQKYDLLNIWLKLNDNTIPQSYVDWVVRQCQSTELSAEENEKLKNITIKDVYPKLYDKI